eukprot:TRINITY_DN45455_c0_g1_i1.p1 TRINITY_DN45455_c0_g1~~TRINITY_DN45455_c0_g1_i1.p1  ORF type:complete len:235 (-),score=25.01 TRINITY_DN45455_c0_g1_i1:67-744(-)
MSHASENSSLTGTRQSLLASLRELPQLVSASALLVLIDAALETLVFVLAAVTCAAYRPCNNPSFAASLTFLLFGHIASSLLLGIFLVKKAEDDHTLFGSMQVYIFGAVLSPMLGLLLGLFVSVSDIRVYGLVSREFYQKAAANPGTLLYRRSRAIQVALLALLCHVPQTAIAGHFLHSHSGCSDRAVHTASTLLALSIVCIVKSAAWARALEAKRIHESLADRDG